jgi:HK97 family phage portal protein
VLPVDTRGTALAVKAKQQQFMQLNSTWQSVAPQRMDYERASREGIRGNIVAAACIAYLQNNFVEPPIQVVNVDGEDQSQHAILAILKRPNPAMDTASYLKLCITYMAVGGNVYQWIERNRYGEPIGLWPWHDGQCAPVPGFTNDRDKAWIDHYEYRTRDGRVYEVPASDVIQLQWATDPDSPTRGLSALAPMAYSIDTMNELNRYTYSFLYNDATPRTVIKLKGLWDQTAKDEAKRDFNELYGGMNKGSAMFTDTGIGDMEIMRLSSQLGEVDAPTISGRATTEISAGFRIHYKLLGFHTDSGDSEDPEKLKKNFTTDTLVPLWSQFEIAWNEQFIAPNYPDDYAQGFRMRFMVELVRALADDKNQAAIRTNNAWNNGLITMNEARKETGRKDLGKDGDVFKLPATFRLVPLDSLVDWNVAPSNPATTPTPIPLPVSDEQRKLPLPTGSDAHIERGQEEQAGKAIKAQAEYNHAAFLAADKKRADLEARFTTAIEKVLANQGKAVIALAKAAYTESTPTKAAYNFPLDWQDDPAMIDVFAAYVEEAADLGIDTAEACFPGLADTFADDLAKIRMEAGTWASKYSGLAIKGLDKTTRRGVRDALAASIAAEDGVDALVERLSQFFDEARARRIAVTETTRAYARGSTRAYKTMGVMRFIFRTAGDEQVDGECATRNGRDYTASTANGLLPVHVSCRCDLEAVPPMVKDSDA